MMNNKVTGIFVMALYSGETIEHHTGKYQLQEQIGEGVQADVYKANVAPFTQELGTVAVKVYQPWERNTAQEGMFKAEAKGLELWHPRLTMMRAHGFGEVALRSTSGEIRTREVPFTALEHSLEGSLEVGKALSIQEVMTVAHDVAEALTYLHSQGLVHRDVKEANILRFGGRYKLADYGGLAEGYVREKKNYQEYSVYPGIYTPEEQKVGAASAASDVYAAALSIESLLLRSLKASTTTREERVAIRLPQKVKTVIQQATAREVRERTSTMEDFLGDFQTAMKSSYEAKLEQQ